VKELFSKLRELQWFYSYYKIMPEIMHGRAWKGRGGHQRAVYSLQRLESRHINLIFSA
jgi:hypothetical protein